MERRLGREDFGLESEGIWARKRTLADGLEAGVELIEMGTGHDEGAMDFLSVVKTKGMGLGDLRFAGLDAFYASPVRSHVSPFLQGPQGMGLLKAVREGLFRAGPFHIGGPEGDHPLHGTAWGTPAQEASLTLCRGEAVLHGAMVLQSLFGPLARIETETRFCPGRKTVEITDRVVNESQELIFNPMYMFHTNCNPMLPHASIHGRFERSEARDARAQEGFGQFRVLAQPEALFAEQVYYHWLQKDDDGFTTVAIVNQARDKAISVSYGETFPILVQWKCLRLDFQVCGLEGSTSKVEGSSLEEKEGRTLSLAPQASQTYRARIAVHTTPDEVKGLLRKLGE